LLVFLEEDSVAAMFEEHAVIEEEEGLTLCKHVSVEV
jgi:hypothetical protein